MPRRSKELEVLIRDANIVQYSYEKGTKTQKYKQSSSIKSTIVCDWFYAFNSVYVALFLDCRNWEYYIGEIEIIKTKLRDRISLYE